MKFGCQFSKPKVLPNFINMTMSKKSVNVFGITLFLYLNISRKKLENNVKKKNVIVKQNRIM